MSNKCNSCLSGADVHPDKTIPQWRRRRRWRRCHHLCRGHRFPGDEFRRISTEFLGNNEFAIDHVLYFNFSSGSSFADVFGGWSPTPEPTRHRVTVLVLSRRRRRFIFCAHCSCSSSGQLWPVCLVCYAVYALHTTIRYSVSVAVAPTGVSKSVQCSTRPSSSSDSLLP